MKEKATVIKKENGQSLVKIIRMSACSHCDEKCMLADDSHDMEEMEVLVNDPVGAEVGNMVELEMGAKPILFSAFIVYLVPLISLIAGYFIGSSWFSSLAANSEIAGILGSVVSFFLSFLILRAFDKKVGSKSYFHPKITRVVSNNSFHYEN